MACDYNGTVEQVRTALGDKRYWLARLADSGVDESKVDALEAKADGSTRIATTQTLHRDKLPGIATQFLRGDLHITREETWSPVRNGVATADVKAAIPGAPVTVTGTARLEKAAKGSALAYHVKVEVNIPLVGGKLEDAIRDQLSNLLIAEQRFTTVWLSENA